MEARMGRDSRIEARCASLDAQHDSATAARRDAQSVEVGLLVVCLVMFELQLRPLRCPSQSLPASSRGKALDNAGMP